MIAALLVCFFYGLALWLVFFKFKWIKFSIVWGVVSGWVGLHLILAFVIGLRFMTPYSTDAKVVQHTIQLVPRLTEPTLVTAVFVEPNTPVKKGQPLFEFDRRPYEFTCKKLEAQLAHAKQDVLILKADVDVTAAAVPKAQNELAFAEIQSQRYAGLAKGGSAPEEDAQQWATQVLVDEAALKQAVAEATRARVRYTSDIDGVNTTVAAVQAELEQARYYLDNTTLVAPEAGTIVNLQVRPGMVAGDYRLGAIAALIVDADRYVLANYTQETLKYVKPKQLVEVAFDLYPGQIFSGYVDSIWWASGEGQLLPSGTLPKFNERPPKTPQGLFAVKIYLNGGDQSKFPIGAQGATAIYTKGGGFAVLRRIVIRTYSWMNWLYPIPF